MNEDDHNAFERRAGQLLRDGADNLDGPTLARLARARAAAIEPPRHRWFDLRYLAPAGATAAALLLTLLYLGPGSAPDAVNAGHAGALDDMELLADAEAFELGEEADLDFIEWAAAMGPAASAGG
ncbi:MAG: hypothetical protein ABW278_04610 [Steroidobacteraceae bacterium]